MSGYKVLSFDKISSTQTYAHDLIAQGRASDHTLIVAAAQYAGRGRYRRKWVSHHGNFYGSFIFDSVERDPRLSYAVAVAIAETIISYGISPLIKWPNDILINNAKVAGVLIEYVGRYVIVGIGINVHTNPTVPEYKTTRLDEYANVDLKDMISRLVKNMDNFLRADFDVVRRRWMELAAGLNKLVKYRGETVELIGVNDNGALVVRRGAEYLLIHGDEILM